MRQWSYPHKLHACRRSEQLEHRYAAVAAVYGLTHVHYRDAGGQDHHRAAPEQDRKGRQARHYLIRAIPYQDPQQEAERLKAVHEARVKIVPRV